MPNRKLFVIIMLAASLFFLYRVSQGAPACPENTLEKVGSNRETIAIFSGEDAKNLVQKLDSRANYDWANTNVKVVSGARFGYIHLLIIENNCIVSIISRMIGTHQTAVSQ